MTCNDYVTGQIIHVFTDDRYPFRGKTFMLPQQVPLP